MPGRKQAALLGVACLLLGQPCLLHADWKDDTGWTQLSTLLGAGMPTGAGVPVLHVEADGNGEVPDYLAQSGGPGSFAGSGVYTGKTFYPLSGQGLASGHAATVASFWYQIGTSAAPGVSQIHAQRAVDYVFDALLAPDEALVLPGRVQNHSWIGTTEDVNLDVSILRRFDHMVNRDGVMAMVGLRNDSAMAALMGNQYHGITVGSRTGSHSQGGTNLDGTGRMKPDLVSSAGLTSYSTGLVSGMATLLMQGALDSAVPDADRPQVIKAVLLAGASKQALPGWRRLSNERPYDEVFGAGEVNIWNAWHIQAGGRHGPSESLDRPARGWDFGLTTTAAGGRRYFFTVPQGAVAATCSAAVTWHRMIDLELETAVLPDLTLRLWAADGFMVTGSPVAVSSSLVDNVEHVFLRNLPPGQYALEVAAGADDTAYGLAWQVETGPGPQLQPRREGSRLFLDATGLDPWVEYEIQSSATLTGTWDVEATFKTATIAASFDHVWEELNVPVAAKFYRLRWTAVR